MGCSSLGPSALNTYFSQLFVLRLLPSRDICELFQACFPCHTPSCSCSAHCRAFALNMSVESRPAPVFNFPSSQHGLAAWCFIPAFAGDGPFSRALLFGQTAWKETLQKKHSHPDSMGSFPSCALCVKAASPGRCLITSLPR